MLVLYVGVAYLGSYGGGTQMTKFDINELAQNNFGVGDAIETLT